MRISRFVASGLLGVALCAASPALAFDPSQPVLPLPGSPSPSEGATDSFRLGAEAYNIGDLEAAFTAFSQAAEQGNAVAQWKIGRMYADGEGTTEDDYKAFQMFSRVADAHAEDNPYSPVSRVVADAFVNLGNYYKRGIDGSVVKPDLKRAMDLFTHAATYFGDADAQYQLAQLYLDGEGVQSDPGRAVRWLNLAARKNHVAAQATLGDMLVYGHGVQAMPERGYMWLLVARENATAAERDWILSLLHRAENTLSADQADVGETLAQSWLQQNS